MKLLIGSLLSLLLLAACASTDDVAEGPAELVDFEPQRKFARIWSNGVGNGQGDVYNLLQPAFDSDAVYVAAANGKLEAIDLASGDTKWRVDLDENLIGGTGQGADHLFVAANNGDVIALDKSNGEALWRVNAGAEVLSPPQAYGRNVYLQSLDGQMIALDLATGERVWSFRNTLPATSLRGTSTPLIYRDQVIGGFANGKVTAFDMETGAVRWDVRVAVPKGNSEIDRIVDVDAPLFLDGNVLYAVSSQGNVAAIDPDSGRKLWSREASSHVAMSQGFGNLYVVGDDGSITAFIKNGQGVRWTQTVFSRRKLTGSAVVGSYVVVGDFEGYLHALSQVDGELIARTRVDSDGLRAQLIGRDDRIYLFSNSGRVAAYELRE